MTKWKCEYRGFMANHPKQVLDELDAARKLGQFQMDEKNVIDLYCVAPGTDVVIKLRGDKMKAKGPVKAIDDLVDEIKDERWFLPVESAFVADALGIPNDKPVKIRDAAALKAYLAGTPVQTSDVEKAMRQYTTPMVEVEFSHAKFDSKIGVYTLCVSADSPHTIRSVIQHTPAIDTLIKSGAIMKMNYTQAVRYFGKRN
jgi:hypothetical protein